MDRDTVGEGGGAKAGSCCILVGLACDTGPTRSCMCCVLEYAQPPDPNVPDDVGDIPHEAQESVHCLTHALVNLFAILDPTHPHVKLTHSSIIAIEVLQVLLGPHGQSDALLQQELRAIAEGLTRGATVDAATNALQLLGVSFDFVGRASSLLNPDINACDANVVSWLNQAVMTKPPAALLVKSRSHYFVLTLFSRHPTLMTKVDSLYADTPVMLLPGLRALLNRGDIDHVFVCHASVDAHASLQRVQLLEKQANAFLGRLDQHLSAFKTGTHFYLRAALLVDRV
jgi:hypothetical protein